jgi:hypothetical protein
MAINASGSIAQANVSQSVFGKADATSRYVGYQIQNTSASVLYFEDNGGKASASSMQLAAGATYTAPDGCIPFNGVQIFGATQGQTYVAKIY